MPPFRRRTLALLWLGLMDCMPWRMVNSSLCAKSLWILATLEEYARNNPIDFTQHIDEFRLVETRRKPMQDFTILDTYRLGKG